MTVTALLSVSDKTSIVDFARALHTAGVKLLSTGGTAKLLAQSNLPVTEVSEVTGFPEMLDGRVKTLHPRIHGGLLARRGNPEHMAALKAHGIDTIDLLVINLYPFAQATAKADCTLDDAIENIDIGGPAMLRAAAKNWQDVAVVIDPADYARVLAELKAGAIANYLFALDEKKSRREYPDILTLQFSKLQDLRYGENPHQSAAFYREAAHGRPQPS